MRRLISIGVVGLMAILWGCGGAAHGTPSESAGFRSDCSPDPVSTGESVECPIGEARIQDLQDCTFFVSRSGSRKIPVEAYLSEGEGGPMISFRVPPTVPVGTADLEVGCGDRFKTLASFNVTEPVHASGEDGAIHPEHDSSPSANPGDTVIAPSLPTPPAEGSAETRPASPPPPTPVTPPAFDVSLEGSLVANPTRFGAAHLSGRIQGGGALREAYLYGPFAPDGNCEHVLALDPSGGPLNPGSRNYETYRGFVGHACDEAAGNCEGFTATAEDGTPSPVNCRIDLDRDHDAFDFYFRLSRRVSSSYLVVEAEDGTLSTDGVDITAPIASLSNTRFVISDTAPEISVSFAYANAATAPVVMGCRAIGAQPITISISGSGSVTDFRCALESGTTVTAMVLGIGGTDNSAQEVFRVQCGETQIALKRMSFTGDHGETCPVTDGGWSANCDAKGEFELQGEAYKTCEISRRRADGTFEVVTSQSIPWVNQMKLTEVDAACTTANNTWVSVTPDMVRNGRAVINRRLKRSYECMNYGFWVQSADGRMRGASEQAPYAASFELMPGTADQYCRGSFEAVRGSDLHVVSPGSTARVYKSTYNQCPVNAGAGVFGPYWYQVDVSADANASAAFKISWRGKHLKSVRYSCTTGGPGVDPAVVSRIQRYDNEGRSFPLPTSVRNVSVAQPDISSYAVQTAADGFKIYDDLMWATVSCTLTAVTYDNREIVSQSQHWDACSSAFPTCLAR